MAEDRTLGQLVVEASRDLSEIVRAEIALAKAEMKRDARNGAVAGSMFGAAGYFAFLASVTGVIAAGYGLVAAGLPAWAAFAVVTAALLLLAAVLGLIGRSRVGKIRPPGQTFRSTRATIAAVKPHPDGR